MKSISKTLIRLATALIPSKSLRRSLRRRLLDKSGHAWLEREVPRARADYEKTLSLCRVRRRNGEKIRVCFLVCDVSMFSFEPVYQQMRSDDRYEAFIGVVPRVTRGKDFLAQTLSKTMDTLTARYGSAVRSLYDIDTRRETPLEGLADVVFTSIVYDDQTCARWTAAPMSRSMLVLGLLYAYGGIFNFTSQRVAILPQISLFWRFFASNQAQIDSFIEANPFLRETIRMGGYPKMDRLAEVTPTKDRPKTILICPHHTLSRGEGVALALSNFLRLANFFLRLPEEFPNVRFVFRPHPLLFPRLATDEWWGEEKTDAYRRALEAHANVEFQQGGDYFQTFIDSDAMIHDCGSFLAEYFYTGKPQCYLVDNPELLREQLTPFGERLLQHVVQAQTEKEISTFITSVLNETYETSEEVRRFAHDEICVAHPSAARLILKELNDTLSQLS